MAKIKAQANGNKDVAATWAGGVIPGPGDEAYANGFTITVNTNWTVALFTTAVDAIVGAVAGGTFSVTANCTITGNAVTGVVAAGTVNVLTLSSGLNFTLVGNLTAGGGKFDADGTSLNAATGTYTFIGNVTGGIGGNCWGIRAFHGGTALLVVNGNPIGGSASPGIATQGGAIVINGNPTGTSTPGLLAFSGSSGAGACQVNGLSIASTTANVPGVSGHTGLTSQYFLIRGAVTTLVLGASIQPYTGSVRFLDNPTFAIVKQDGTILTLTNPADTQDFPAPANVRKNVSYKNGDFVGTLAVPPPGSVAAGVPTDNTVGIAILSAAQVAAVIESALND